MSSGQIPITGAQSNKTDSSPLYERRTLALLEAWHDMNAVVTNPEPSHVVLFDGGSGRVVSCLHKQIPFASILVEVRKQSLRTS